MSSLFLQNQAPVLLRATQTILRFWLQYWFDHRSPLPRIPCVFKEELCKKPPEDAFGRVSMDGVFCVFSKAACVEVCSNAEEGQHILYDIFVVLLAEVTVDQRYNGSRRMITQGIDGKSCDIYENPPEHFFIEFP
jgi:hypothetical protein